MIEVIVMDKELYTPADIAPKTLGSAGLDLKLTRDAKSAYELDKEGATWPYHDLIGTGLKVRVPTNMVGLIVPRSSAGHKHGFRIGNTIGVIDSDYRGEIMMSIGGGDYGLLKRGATVAQLILVPYSSFYGATIVDKFSDETDRGDGGFGSTDNLLIADSCPGKGCADKGCPVHHEVIFPSISATEQMLLTSREWAELSPTQRGNCGNARHEAGCQQCDDYATLARLNGNW